MLARDEARSESENVIRLIEHEHHRPARWKWLALTLALAVIAAVGFVLTRGGEPGVGTARELRRAMHVRSGDGDFRSVRTHPTVVAGDTVRTDRRGRGEIDYGDGSLTRLDSNTTFRVEELTKGARRVMDAKLTKGRVWNNVRKLASVDDRFQVETPNAVATVRGTIFVCEVAPTGSGSGVDTTCIQITGRTEVRFDDGTTVDLTPGECTTNGGACKYTPEQLASMLFLREQAAADGVQLPWGSQPTGNTGQPQLSVPGGAAPGGGPSSPTQETKSTPREPRVDDGIQDAGQPEDDDKRPRRDRSAPTNKTPDDSGDDEGDGSGSGSGGEPSGGGGSGGGSGGGDDEGEDEGGSDDYTSNSGGDGGASGGGCSGSHNRNDCRDGNGSDGNAGKGNDDQTRDKKKPKS